MSTYPLSVRILNAAYSIFLNLLNRSVGENAFLFSIRIETLHCAVWEVDFLRAVREMLLDLLVLELEDLHPIWEGSLRCLCICEEVAYFSALEALLNVVVLEEHYLVAIRPDFPLHTVREDDFLLAIVKDPLDLPFRAYKFFDQFLIFGGFI